MLDLQETTSQAESLCDAASDDLNVIHLRDKVRQPVDWGWTEDNPRNKVED